MIKKEKVLYTYHDELLSDLLIPKIKNDKEKTSIKLINQNKLLSAQEIFMLIIILDHFKKSDNIPLDFKHIQIGYRNRRLAKGKSIPKQDFKSYCVAINELMKERVTFILNNTRKHYNIKKTKYNEKRLISFNCKSELKGNKIIDYNLGEYGEVLLKSKRFSDLLPIEILHLSYKQISVLYIGLYLARLIYINRRKRKAEFCVTIKSIMQNIMLHKVNGANAGITLSSKLEEDISNKYSYINNFRKHLEMVLKMLIDNKSIKSYEIVPIDINNINISNYEKIKLQINIK